ncbi:PTS sugar transporter subunit IIA [Paratissierella segnis]|uniref:PTS sugar transporter subunit IIA n=1 Tax=Paratissierella segnis TaxID=2763679 RepID=A0A926IJB5_9FIRM|nr:PTS sugar transporter subunit IIA [Paratissierella segnis]MBC8587849.1 PTS sugar transporter subunit IIA [Paratissierella segnis]
MIGIIIISHGILADGLLESSKMLCGESAGVVSAKLEPTDSPDMFRKKLEIAIEKVDEGEGILILADIPGGTPANQGVLLQKHRDDIEVITGVNVPLLIEAIMMRGKMSLPLLLEHLLNVGKESIESPMSKLDKESNLKNSDDQLDQLITG